MPTKKETILNHKDKIELIKGLIKAERTVLTELYEIGEYGSYADKIRNQAYKALENIVAKVSRVKDNGCDCAVERETDETITLNEALEELADGHGVISPKGAYQICKAVGVPYNKGFEYHGFSSFEFKGLQMKPECEGELIVDISRLGSYITSYLNLEVAQYRGRGSQASAYVSAIQKHFAKLTGEEVKES